jgi:phosphoribosyl 1,2-cyclic phosphodiesterase
MIGFCPLASGSKGNCIYFGTEKTKILIDVGLSARATALRLQEIGVSLDAIDAILITHEHIDHIRGLEQLGCRKKIPVLCNSDTAKGIYEVLGECPPFKIFSTGETFTFQDLEIHPFSVQHDTLDPVAFTIKTNSLKIGFCTDLGFVTTGVIQALKQCDYLYLEANHQPSMVHASARPPIYKQRVLGRQGHLSNDECAALLTQILNEKLKHVHLAHLSSECNAPELALEIINNKLKEHNALVDVSIAYQEKNSKPILF